MPSDAPTSGQQCPAPATSRRRWQALALLCAASFMVILDGTIVFVAAPSVVADLQLAPSTAQWLFTAYLLPFGGFLLFCGRAADLLGRRRVFMFGVALFTGASLLCGVAGGAEVLIGARALQGISAAVMAPTALSILMTTFVEGSERNKALGVWSAVGGMGGTAGALIGGPLTDGLGWEWIFLINVPVGLVLFGLSPILLAESRVEAARRSFDPAGALTITSAVGILVYAVVEAPAAGWGDAQTVALLAGFAALLTAFVAIEMRSAAPMVPLRLFRSRSLVGGNVVMLAVGMTVFGMGSILTRYAQEVLGHSALEYGLMTAVMTVAAVAGSLAGQALVTRVGVRSVAAASMSLLALACVALAQVSPDGSYLADIFPGLLIFGPGLGAGFVAGSISALTGVGEQDAGLASGVNTAAFQIGGALGIAILTTVAVSGTAEVGDPGGGPAALTQGFRSAFLVAVAFAAVGLIAALALLWRRAAPVGQRDLPAAHERD